MKNNKLIQAECNLDVVAAMLCLAVLIAITFAGVIMRYLVNRPIVWQEEVQLALVLWMIFLGGSAVFRAKSHVAIDIFVDLFPDLIRKAVRVLVFLVVLSILFFMAYNGAMMVKQFFAQNRYTNMLKIPVAFVYAAIPVGCSLMILNASYEFVSDMFFAEREESGEAGHAD